MISDARDVGTDLKVARKRQGSDNLGAGFLRPAGVDSPSTESKREAKSDHDLFETNRGKRVSDGENKDGERRKKKRKRAQLSPNK